MNVSFIEIRAVIFAGNKNNYTDFDETYNVQ